MKGIAPLLLAMWIASFGGSGRVARVGETTVHFGRQEGCQTVRATMSAARAGDAVQIQDWKLGDGSFVHAAVTRDGTIEVERCACGEAGPAAVRVRVVRVQSKEAGNG